MALPPPGCCRVFFYCSRGILRFNAKNQEEAEMNCQRLWNEESGQDIAEYAVMLAVILVIVVGTLRLIGSNSNNAFSSVASSLQ